MGAPISIRKRTMIMKKEAVRGTLVTWPSSWATTDFDIEFFNIEVTRELAEYERMYALGDHDSLASVFGKRRATVSASIDLRWSGDNDTPPNLSKALHALGLLETVTDSTSVKWNPDKACDLGGGVSGATDLPFDIAIQDEVMGSSPKALTVLIRGALGNASIVMDEGGQPLRLDCEFTGVLDSIVDTTTPLGPDNAKLDTTLPDVVLSSTITAHTKVKRIDTLTLDFGNVVELENAPANSAGLLAAYISERHPILTINPLADLLANDDIWTRWTGSTEGALVIQTAHFAINAAKAQLITNTDAEQNGARAHEETYKLLRDSTNGYPWIITHS
jgi:hypothetical protein